jgi:hypothetical protein
MEPRSNETTERGKGLAGIFSAHFEIDFGPTRHRQGHQSKDALSVCGLALDVDEHPRSVLSGEARELGGRTQMET